MADTFTPPPLSSYEGPAEGFTPPPVSAEEKPSALREFITSPHGFIREGARTIGQGARELFTPGQRMKGATDVIHGAGSVLAPVAIGASIPALTAAPAATIGGMAMGTAGAGLGSAGGRSIARAMGGGEQAQELGGELGGLAGGFGGGAAGARLIPKATAMVPSAERAGRNFERVMQAAGTMPVDLTKASAPVIRALELERAGSGAPPPVISKMAERIPQHTDMPMTFKEARDFQSNAGRLSAAESLNAKPQMKAQVAQLAKALADENQSVAEKAGVGDLYAKAMKEYRQAKTIEGVKENAKDLAKSTAAKYILGGAGLGAGYGIARKVLGE